MVAALPGARFLSPEHDGVVTDCRAFELLQDVVAPLKLARKEIPEDPFAEAKVRFNLPFERRALVPLKTYAQLRFQAKMLLARGVATDNTITFAAFVAASFDDRCVVPFTDGERRQGFEFYTDTWRYYSAADMSMFVGKELLQLVKPLHREAKREPPKPLNRDSFAASLSMHVLATVAERSHGIPALDGKHSRYMLLFSDGVLFDFKEMRARRAMPADRLGFHTGFPYTAWEPSFDATHVFEGLASAYKTGSDVEALDAMFRDLAKECTVLMVIYRMQESWAAVFYVLRFFTRAVVAEARFCEFLYVYGAAAGGKDVLLLLFLTFFGSGANNYGYLLPGGFLANRHTLPGKESASPFLAEAQGKRFVWCSEVPQHNDLDMGLLKAYCEQTTPVAARRLYRAPTIFEPMGWLVASSNFPPRSREDDDGFARRNRVLVTKKVFSTTAADENDRPDPTLKGKIRDGAFNGQLLWLAKKLLPTLDKSICKGTNIEPVPSCVQEFVDQAMPKPDFSVEEWAKERTEPVPRTEATPAALFRAALAAASNKGLDEVQPLMTRAGMKSVANSSHQRVIVWAHPARTAGGPLPGLKLK